MCGLIQVVGLGYIGLPTALMLTCGGYPVIGVDCNDVWIKKLQNRQLDWQEEGLVELLDEALTRGIYLQSNCVKGRIYIVAVPTPFDHQEHCMDDRALVSAVAAIAQVCECGSIICIESTVAPGTLEGVVKETLEAYGWQVGIDIHLVHAPERVMPGNMLKELSGNDRLIGCSDRASGLSIKKIYECFCKGDIYLTSIRTAEMVKVAENTFRDVNIAYANELLKICQQAEVDVYEVIKLANKHPRVDILQPGPGVGGHCIGVDPWFLVGVYPDQAQLVATARRVNESMVYFTRDRIDQLAALHGIVDYGQIGIYGLSYKADLEDVRESPSLKLIELLEMREGGVIPSYDPYQQRAIVRGQCMTLEVFLKQVQMIVVMVGHKQLQEQRQHFAERIVLDARNSGLEGDSIYKL